MAENETYRDIFTISQRPFNLWSLVDGLTHAKNNDFDMFLVSSARHVVLAKTLEQLKHGSSVVYPDGVNCGQYGTVVFKKAFDGMINDLIMSETLDDFGQIMEGRRRIGMVQSGNVLLELKKERHIINKYFTPDRYTDILPPQFDV